MKNFIITFLIVLLSGQVFAQETWYTFTSGEWGEPNSWTLDGATAPIFVNPDDEIPGAGDVVIIRNSHNITMLDGSSLPLNNVSVDAITVRSGSILSLASTTGHDFTTISGGGTISIAGAFVDNGADDYYTENLPAGDFTDFANAQLGGTLQVETGANDVPLILNGTLNSTETVTLNGATETVISRRLVVNMGDLDDRVILQRDLAVTGNLRVTQGNFQIHADDAEPFEAGTSALSIINTNLNLNIQGDVIITANGHITTGTANNRHQFNLDQDFTNDGTQTTSFTQLTAQSNAAQSNGVVDLNFLNDSEDQELVCNGPTHIYRIEIDKDAASVELSILATESGGISSFRLFGPTNNSINANLQSGDTNNNALGLLSGAVRLGTNVEIPTFGSGAIYSIGDQAQLIVDGGAAGFTGSNAIVLYGRLEVASGELFVRGFSGVVTREAGTFAASGGQTYMSQFRTSTNGASAVGGYEQSAGEVTMGSFSESRTYSGIGATYNSSGPFNGYYTLSLSFENNVFLMSGGILNVTRANDADDGSIFINSSAGNINVTGGTVNVFSTSDAQARITSRAPFYNLNIINQSTGTTANDRVVVGTGTSSDGVDPQTIINPDLVVLNDLTIQTGTTRTANIDEDGVVGGGNNPVSNTWGSVLDLCPDNTCVNLVVGRNLTIEDQAVLDVWGWDGSSNNASATVTFNGSNDGVFYIGDITTYTNSLVQFSDPGASGRTRTFNGQDGSMVYWELPLYDWIINKSNATLFLSSKLPGKGQSPNNDESRFINSTNGGKNTSRFATNLIKVTNSFQLLSGTLNQVDPNSTVTITEDDGATFGSVGDPVAYSIRLLGEVVNQGTCFIYEDGVTPKEGIIVLRKDAGDFTLNTTPGASFGNFRVLIEPDTVFLTSDLSVGRLEFSDGILDIGTHNLRVDVLEMRLAGGTLGQTAAGQKVFSTSDFIRMAGNASDGGLSVRVPRSVSTIPNVDEFENLNSANLRNWNAEYNQSNVIWFPIGTGNLTSGLKYTPAVVYLHDNGTTDGDEYITVRVVDTELQTTDLAGGDVLSYYWSVDFEGYASAEEPTVSWLFQYDEDDIDAGDETIFVPGRVLNGGDYARSDDGGSDAVKHGGAGTIEGNLLGNDPRNVILFNGEGSSADLNANDGIDNENDFIDGIAQALYTGNTNANTAIGANWTSAFPGMGFALERANYTAGAANRFVGSPAIYYNRRANNIDWNNNTSWYDSPTGTTNPPDFPGQGDIAVIRGDFWTDNITINGSQAAAEVIFEREGTYIDIESLPRLRFEPGDVLDVGVVSGVGDLYFQQNLSNTSILNGDIGLFAANDTSLVQYYMRENGTYNVSESEFFSVLPTLRIYGQNQGGNRIVSFDYDMSMKNLIVDGESVLQIGGNYNVEDRTRLGFTGGGRIQFPNGINAFTLSTGELVTGKGKVQADDIYEITVQTGGGNGVVHTLEVNRDIILDFVDRDGTMTMDLFSTQIDNNVRLKLSGEGNHEFTDGYPAATIDLYQIEMNKGGSSANSFTFQDDFTIPDATASFQPLEIVNGNLIFNDPNIDILAADGSDFNLPNLDNTEASSGSGGLEVQQGLVRIGGDDTGLILDGPLVLSGGDVSIIDAGSNGNNFIEYSASGNASITVSDAASTLQVGRQIRRNTLSTSGVLNLTITAGLVEIGGGTNGLNSRSMLEIVNSGSSFTHTGGTLRFLRQNGTTATNASIASLLLEPGTSDISGTSLIDINLTNGDPRFNINSLIALNNLTIRSSDGVDESEVVRLRTRSLTVNGDLSIDDDLTFDANNLDVTLNGNLSLLTNADYLPGLNTTTFSSSDDQNLDVNTSQSISFYNFGKSEAGQLDLLNGDVAITGPTFELEDGTLADNDNLITFSGQTMTNNGTHVSTTAITSGGIIFNGTSQQNLETDTEGIFGNLTLDNAGGIALPDFNQVFTVNDRLTLADGILDIGPALLRIGENGTIVNGSGAGTTFTDFDENTQIQTNSSIIDFGVEKFFAGGSSTDFLFPVGEATRYTPVLIDFSDPEATTDASDGSSGTAAGSVRVRPRNTIAPIMQSESQARQDSALQYHWLINEFVDDDFVADIVVQYDDETIGTNNLGDPVDQAAYRGARAIFSDPNLAVENPFPGDGTDLFDETVSVQTITFPINGVTNDEDDFSGEYFAGDPDQIPDSFSALIFNAGTDESVSTLSNYIIDENNDGIINPGEVTNPSNFNSDVVGGAVRLADGVNLTIDASDVIFSRTIIPETSSVTVDYSLGATNTQLGLVTGSGTIVINSNGSNAALPPGDYEQFFLSCGSGGGAIEYGGSGSYPILAETNRVRQLTLSGAGTKSLPANLVTICEDLIITDGTATLADGTVGVPIEIEILGSLLMQNGTLNFGENSTVDIEGDANFSGGSTVGNSNTVLEIAGDLIQSGGATLTMTGANRGTFRMNGTSPQNITGDFSGTSGTPANSIGNLVINNSSGVTITAGAANRVRVNNRLSLTNGRLFSDVPAVVNPIVPNELIIIGSNATILGGSASSHIDGAVRKESIIAGTGNFIFPVGDNGFYAPARIANPSLATSWTVIYRNQEPPVRTQVGGAAGFEVSNTEYWAIDGATAGTTATISVTYGTQSGVVDPTGLALASLKDLDLDGLLADADEDWQEEDANNSGSSASSGTLSTTNPISFSSLLITLGGQAAGILPVDLVFFKGTAADNKVSLIWRTASELNNDYFEMQRSRNGIDFETIGRVAGNGTTNDVIDYDFKDRNPYAGVSFYRLKQFDFDGVFEIHEIIRINNKFVRRGIEASTYPNPSVGSDFNVRVQTGDENSPILIRIVDMAGRSYYEKSFSGTLILDEKVEPTAELKQGIYFMLVKQGANTSRHKIVIR